MKLIATMMLTVDGVYQGPVAPDEDRRDGFDRGGWTAAAGPRRTPRRTWGLSSHRCSGAPARCCSDAGHGRSGSPIGRTTTTIRSVESRSMPSGVVLQTYRPAGRATFGAVG